MRDPLSDNLGALAVFHLMFKDQSGQWFDFEFKLDHPVKRQSSTLPPLLENVP